MDDQNQQNPATPANDPASGGMGGGAPTPPPAGGDMGGGMPQPDGAPTPPPAGGDMGGSTPPAAPAEGGDEHPQGGMPQS